MAYVTFRLSLFAEPFAKLRFGLSTEVSQKVKISLSRNFDVSSKLPVSKKAQRKWSKYILRPKFS